MKLIINGEEKIFDTNQLTVSTLLIQLNLTTDHIAVERNQDIVPKSVFNETQLIEGDKIEIVQFVGGG